MLSRLNAVQKIINPLVILGILIAFYLVLRIINVAITDDECLSYNLFVTEGWWSILTATQQGGGEGWAGNDHILNSLLMKFELLVFGKYDWALRLHVVVSFIVAYYFMVKIVRQITPSTFRQTCYLGIIFLNPYLLDFFGLARGYALCFAAWSYAFYYFLTYTETLSTNALKHVLLGFFLAIWSSFSAVYLFFFLSLSLIYTFYRQRKSDFINKHIAYFLLACSIIGFVNLVPLYRTIHAGTVYGGEIGIFNDMIVTSIERFIHKNEGIDRFGKYDAKWTTLEVAGMVFFALWLTVIVLGLSLKTDKKTLKTIAFYALLQVIGVAVLSKILFVNLKILYPTGRTNLLFSFPFLIATIAAFELLVRRLKLLNLVLFLLIPVYIWHLNACYNLYNTRDWWTAGDGKTVLVYLKDYLSSNNYKNRVNLGADNFQYFAIDFYGKPQYEDVINVKFSDMSKDSTFDFFFVPTFKNNQVGKEFELVHTFKTGTLFKRK